MTPIAARAGTGRVALRLAWRLVRRAPARSALIAALVAIPVLAGTFALVTISTARLSAGQAADRYLGHADAIADVTANPRLDPRAWLMGRGRTYSGEPVSSEGPFGDPRRPRGAVDLAALLPPGAQLTAGPANAKTVEVTAGTRTAQVTAHPVDIADPVARGLFSLMSGTAPTGSGQVAVTASLAHRLHLAPGDHATVSGIGDATVAAIVRDPRALSEDAVVAPLTAFGGMAAFEHGAYSDPSWLIAFPGLSLIHI